jgi:hypothetical protein
VNAVDVLSLLPIEVGGGGSFAAFDDIFEPVPRR